MLKELDWYIIKKYLSTFFFVMVLITMIAVVIDFSDKTDKFVHEDLGLKQIMGEYYLNFIPWINGRLWPLFALIAVIFFTSRMAKNSEIISILAAGVSYRRFLVPYIVAGSFLSILLWVGNNFIIPKSNKIKNEFESTYIKKSQERTLGTDIHLYLKPDEKIYLRHYKKRDTTGTTFRYEKFDGKELKYFIKAKKIELKEMPNVWTLIEYEKRSFNGLNEFYLSGKGEKMDTILDLTHKDFIRNTHAMETMTSAELVDFIGREQDRGLGSAKKYDIELERRQADPFTILILTLIGVAVASRKTRGGLGLHLAVGVIISASYVVLAQFSITFSTNLSLSPRLGCWIPNLIFIVVAIGLIFKAQK